MQVLERQTGARRETCATLDKIGKDAIRPPNTKHMLRNLKRGLDRIEGGRHPHLRVAWWAYWCGHGTTNTRSKLVTEPSATAPGFKGLPSIREKLREERRNAEFFTRITTLHRCNWQHQYEVPSTDSSISILGLTFTFKCQQAQFNYMCVYSYQERLTLW